MLDPLGGAEGAVEVRIGIELFIAEFAGLIEQLKIWQFDRLGCFVFSPEEGTEAYSMKGKPAKRTAEKRQKEVMELQQQISLRHNQERLHQIFMVTLESVSDDGIFYMGRSYGEAPEVDPAIYVAASEDAPVIGKTYAVEFVDCSPYDITGVIKS